MKKLGAGILIIGLYCFPYVYFAMYTDFKDSSMFGYLIMIVASSAIAFFGKVLNLIPPIVAGNILSAIISHLFIGRMDGNERWGGYFKPLTADQLFIVNSILVLLPQLIAMKLAKTFKVNNQRNK